ncbi:hypothetical protein HA402_003757 [Bradysia odoriphaga]|nr:hypothetical protein HA402_003757 [Bradysia odoriphaga]
MEQKTTSAGAFEEAIKNFSKMSLEVDSLINAGNADAHRLMNKSIENRNEAIANEATKRLKSFEMERKKSKSNEALTAHDTVEQLLREEVKMEFDKGVEEQRIRLRGDSANDVSKGVENKKSENADDDDGSMIESSDEESEDESGEDTDDTETTEKDSSDDDDEEEDSSSSEGEDTDDDKSAGDEEQANEVDSSKK